MRSGTVIVSVATLVMAIGAMSSRGEAQKDISTKETMRLKLHYAQRVLEGIATENYAVLEDSAARLKNLSGQAGWKVKASPEYERLTAEFARNTGALIKASKARNIDAATVAYFQLTVSCTTCHGYLRGERGVGLVPGSSEGTEVADASANLRRRD